MPKLPKLFIHLSSSDVQKGDIPPLAGEMSPFFICIFNKATALHFICFQKLFSSSLYIISCYTTYHCPQYTNDRNDCTCANKPIGIMKFYLMFSLF